MLIWTYLGEESMDQLSTSVVGRAAAAAAAISPLVEAWALIQRRPDVLEGLARRARPTSKSSMERGSSSRP